MASTGLSTAIFLGANQVLQLCTCVGLEEPQLNKSVPLCPFSLVVFLSEALAAFLVLTMLKCETAKFLLVGNHLSKVKVTA